jgi:hypothetical protein
MAAMAYGGIGGAARFDDVTAEARKRLKIAAYLYQALAGI